MTCNPLLLNGGPDCFINIFNVATKGISEEDVENIEGGGIAETVDGVAAILFGVMAAVHIIWTIVIATSTGFTFMSFNTWKDAGYNTQFLCSWVFKGI